MVKNFLQICCLAFLLCTWCSSAVAERVPVTGKVAVNGEGVAGVIVSAWPVEVMSFDEEAPYRSAPSDSAGLFSMTLPQGGYYFLASGKEHFGYYGRNPVTVAAGGLDKLNLSLAQKTPRLPEGEPLVETGVLGKISHHGKPLAGASLMVYPDLNSQLKGLGLAMSAPTDESGYLELSLAPGTYYIVARLRRNGQISGPLKAGDFFGYYAANPLVVKPGQVAKIGIDMVKVPQKVEDIAGKLFGNTSIRGKALNLTGAPVAGVRVLLYDNSMMLNRPLYVSQPTNARGEYVLSFPQGGTYYLMARDKLGGAPGPGELIGRHTGSPDSSVTLKTGEHLKGVDMLIEEMW